MRSILYDLYYGKLPTESQALLCDREYLAVKEEMYNLYDLLEQRLQKTSHTELMRLEALQGQFADLHEADGFVQGLSLGLQLMAAAYAREG